MDIQQPTSSSVSSDSISENLTQIVERFHKAWQQGTAPSVDDFLNTSRGGDADTRRGLLLELIKADISNRWYHACATSGDSKEGRSFHDSNVSDRTATTVLFIEDYVRQWPELLGSVADLPLDLIVHEYQVRRRFGNRPRVEDYELRFHTHGDSVRETLQRLATSPARGSSFTKATTKTMTSSYPEATTFPDPDEKTLRGKVDRTAAGTATAGTDARAGTGISLPGRFGNYDLIDEIAHGAMGVVYRARQRNPERTVALKMIKSGELATADEIKRFHAEAKTAGNLQHPNIVSIIESGEHDGYHFMSMEYIEGPSLGQLVRDKPLDNASAARYMKTIAETVHHAHTVFPPVIHRDLKPSNVLIDRYDQPHITDFGVAKRVEEGDTTSTRHGSVMGTPSYMPPEQAQGLNDQVGPHSDVYGLGAILYHLLTGRAPFSAASVLDTLLQVTNSEPAAPRLLNPEVDPDLEAVCLRCLEKDPRQRLASAQELADEMDRVLRGEPTLTRPISAFARFRKWCCRNPAVAALSMVLTLLLFAAAAGSTIAWRHQKGLYTELTNTVGQRDAVRREKDAAEQDRDSAQRDREAAERERDLVNKEKAGILTELGEKQQQVEAAKKSVESLRKDQKSLMANNEKLKSDLSGLATKLAGAEKDLADAEAKARGAVEEAARATTEADESKKSARKTIWGVLVYLADEALTDVPGMDEKRSKVAQDARSMYDELLEKNRDDVQIREECGDVCNLLGTIYHLLGEFHDAEEQYENALKLFEGLATQFAGEHRYRKKLLISHRNLGDLLTDDKQSDKALESYQKALDYGQALEDKLGDQAEENELLFEIARTHNNRYKVRYNQSDWPGAREDLERCRQIYERLRGVYDGKPEHVQELAVCRQKLATAYNNLGTLALQEIPPEPTEQDRQFAATSAIDWLERAIEIQEQLTQSNPRSREYREDYARSHYNLADVQVLDEERLAQARDAIDVAMTEFERLASDFPTTPRYSRELNESRLLAAETRWLEKKDQEAIDLCTQAIDSLVGLQQENSDLDYAYLMALAHYRRGNYYAGTSPPDKGNACADLVNANRLLQDARTADERVQAFAKVVTASLKEIGCESTSPP